MDQSIDQSMDQSINQSINQSIDWSSSRTINQSMGQRINQSISFSMDQVINRTSNLNNSHPQKVHWEKMNAFFVRIRNVKLLSMMHTPGLFQGSLVFETDRGKWRTFNYGTADAVTLAVSNDPELTRIPEELKKMKGATRAAKKESEIFFWLYERARIWGKWIVAAGFPRDCEKWVGAGH